jgi:hypothetical protein
MSLMMMKAVSSYEILAKFNETTRCSIPEGCHFRTRCCENLEPHLQATYMVL